jgi:hypothetical protein
VASVALVAAVPASRRWPPNTIGQVAIVAFLLDRFGRRSVQRWMDAADEVEEGEEGSGEPTPLWHLPLVMGGLAAFFVLLPETGLPGSDAAGWDAGLRITGGCVAVGLIQALRYEPVVAVDEHARGRRYFRAAGSRILRGTNLAYTRSGASASSS